MSGHRHEHVDVRLSLTNELVRRICAGCDAEFISETRADGDEYDWIDGVWRQR